jgi:hypothetical protein
MTTLDKPIRRVTDTEYIGRPIVVTLAPVGGSQSETNVGFRLKGKRTQYVVGLSVLFRYAAQLHAQKEAIAKRAARKNGIPWKKAKKQFVLDNSI